MSEDTTLHNFIPEFWSKKLAPKFDDAGVMMKCVNRNYEGEIKNAGDKVHIQGIGDITVNSYTSDAITYQDLTSDQRDLEIDQKKYFAFAVPDIEKVQANVELVDKYTAKAKKAIELAKDTFLLSKRTDVASANILSDVSPTASNIYDTFVDLRTVLREANAINQAGKAENGKRPWVVVNPQIEKLIILSDEFTSRSTSATDKLIRDGAIFEYAGFDVFSATNLKKASGKIEILAGVDEAITYASQITKIEALRDKDHFQDLVRGLYVYGAKTVNNTLLAKVAFTGYSS